MEFTVERLKNSRSLTNDLVESLRCQIIDGNMLPGTKLPSAKYIEQQAGVSRSVVREAIAVLKAEGIIISRQGIGSFIAESVNKKTFEINEEEFNCIEEAVHILELRMAVEVAMSSMAAAKRTKKQMTHIWKCLEDFDKQVAAGNDAVKEDFAFHLAIADASNNPYFSRFINYIGSGVIPSREIITKNEQFSDPKKYLSTIQKEHKCMAQAIEDKDREGAEQATQEHLENSRRRHIKIAKAFKNS